MPLNKIDFFFFLTLLICKEVHGIINGVASPGKILSSNSSLNINLTNDFQI